MFLYIVKLNFLKKNINPKALGKFETILNWRNIDEIQIINNNNTDIHHLQSLRNFLDNKTVFFLFNPKSELILNFIKNTLYSDLIIFDDRNKIKNFSSEKDLKSFFEKISKYKSYNKVLILESEHAKINNFFSYFENFNTILSKKKKLNL